MLEDGQFKAPIDPGLMSDLVIENKLTGYDQSCDIWSLGIIVLSFIFSIDWEIFYDWEKMTVKNVEIDNYLNKIKEAKYDDIILRILTEMLDFNGVTRISVSRLNDILSAR